MELTNANTHLTSEERGIIEIGIKNVSLFIGKIEEEL